MTDFLHTDARWGEHFVEVSDPHKKGHHVRFYFEPPHDKLIVKLTEMLEIQQKLHETAIDMLKPAIEAEREACAKLLELTDLSGLKSDVWLQNYTATMLDGYAKAIRARGQA
jgi:hypothetical protein